MLDIHDDNGVRTIRMAHGKASALDIEFCEALSAAFVAAGRDPVRAVVLTGTGRIFGAGVDLPRLVKETGDYITRFLAAMDRCFLGLFAMDKPVVAAINGHAIAGGCILAAACDLRLMVDTGATIGAPELGVGVPFPALPLEIMRHAAGTPLARRLAMGCENLTPQEALKTGLVDQLLPAPDLQQAAQQQAQRLAQVPAKTFALVKQQLRSPAMQAVRDLATHNAEVAKEWLSPEVKAAIQRFIDKTLKGPRQG